jgi:hypothetical protein
METVARKALHLAKKKEDSAIGGTLFDIRRTNLLVLVPLRLHALVVFVLRHFFAAFLLDGTHFGISFG